MELKQEKEKAWSTQEKVQGSSVWPEHRDASLVLVPSHKLKIIHRQNGHGELSLVTVAEPRTACEEASPRDPDGEGGTWMVR